MKRLHVRVFNFMMAVTVVAAGFCPLPALADGRFVIKPYIEGGLQYDSNFYRTENDPKGVYTYYLRPGLEVGYNTDKTFVGLAYHLSMYWYEDKDSYEPGQMTAEDSDFTGHEARFFFHTNPSDRLKLELENLYYVTRDPVKADPNDNAVDRYKYTWNQFSPGMIYRFGEKFGLGLKYTNLDTDYAEDGPGQGEDSVENRGTLTGYYYLNSRTALDLDYQYWERDYDKTSSDYTSSQIKLNVRHQLNRLLLTAGAGYHTRKFDDPVFGEDIGTFAWQFSGTWKMPKTQFFLRLSSNFNDASIDNSYYSYTRLDGRIMRQLTERIKCTLSGYYQNSEYETSIREDDRWQIALAGDYLINEYFTVGLAGGYEERDSNMAGESFDNQFIMIKIRFNYDLVRRE